MTIYNISQYKILNSCNDYKPASTLIFNLKSISIKLYLNDSMSINDHQLVPNSSTSEILKDRKCILECSIIPAPPAQVFPISVVPIQASLLVSLALLILDKLGRGQFKKHLEETNIVS